MNILKGCYSELESLVRYLPNAESNEKEFFRNIYLTKKMTINQELQWKELLARQRILYDNQTFLFNLLTSCYVKNRLNVLLINIDLKNKKIIKTTFQYEDYVYKNSLISHICLSNIWIKRRELFNNDALIYLLSEFQLIECLTRKRQLFTQLSGTSETFFNVPYYITRNLKEKQRNDLKLSKSNRRKRTVQFHLHATKQGQQAHLTNLYETLIARNLIQYHISKYERFDIHHPIEKSINGQIFLDSFFQSEFSKTFFNHRPQDEVEQIRENLIPIFEKFHTNHRQCYLRRRTRLPFSYTNHHVPESTATLDQLIPLTTPVSFIQNLIRVWLKKVLPIEFFGSKYNQKLFIRKMCFLIELPRTQEYSLGDAIRRLKFKHCQWSKIPLNSSPLINQLYMCHLVYFLIQYVLILVRSYFYVTEGSSPSHQLTLIFYRHKIWCVIQRKSRKELFYKSCSPSVEQKFINDYDNIRYLWKIRFVPKMTNVRYLACAQIQFNTQENINHLKYTNEILKYLRRHNRHLIGISTFNRVEMHRRWQDYCRIAPEIDKESMTYFLRSDVSNFYDSINLDYLDKAFVEFLDNCEFNYDLYIHTIYKTQYRNGRFIRRKTIYWVGKENEQMFEIMTDATKRLSNGTFHDMIIHDHHVEIYNKEKLLKYIRAQLFNSYLYTIHSKKLPIKTFRRIIGINHGLRIASILGQIYLNRMDRDINFSPLADEFAVRHEDDLLIISPHRYRLRRIKLNIAKKSNELHSMNNNSLTNLLKTKTNIRHTSMKKFRPVEYWGSLVDIQSREILVTINQNETIEKQINQLTIKIKREIGYQLRHSLINALYLRSHSYYFDRLYTSDKTLIRNFYFLSCYFFKRFHSMCVRFSQFYSSKYVKSKSLFLFRTIRSGLRMLIKKAFNYNKKSIKLLNQCKYVFFMSCTKLMKKNKHLYNSEIILKRCLHMIKKLKYLNKKIKYDINKIIGSK